MKTHRIKPRRIPAIASMVVAGAVLLSACGGGKTGDPALENPDNGVAEGQEPTYDDFKAAVNTCFETDLGEQPDEAGAIPSGVVHQFSYTDGLYEIIFAGIENDYSITGYRDSYPWHTAPKPALRTNVCTGDATSMTIDGGELGKYIYDYPVADDPFIQKWNTEEMPKFREKHNIPADFPEFDEGEKSYEEWLKKHGKSSKG